MKRALLSLGIAIALTASGMTAAHATEPDVHPDVAYALATVPGGVVVDWLTAEWPATGMRIEAQGGFSVGSCATGAICAYSSASLAGTKLSWTSCGMKSTAALSSVGSIANARTGGTLRALQGTTSRATAAAGASANVAVSYRALITNVSC